MASIIDKVSQGLTLAGPLVRAFADDVPVLNSVLEGVETLVAVARRGEDGAVAHSAEVNGLVERFEALSSDGLSAAEIRAQKAEVADAVAALKATVTPKD